MATLLSKTQLARRADLDTRTLVHRLKALDIQPAAMLGNGRLLYPESVLPQLKTLVPKQEVMS